MNDPVNQNITLLTVEEFFAIYGGKYEKYELIDGIAYMMSSANSVHQALSFFLNGVLFNFLKGKKCQGFAAPYDVFLNESPKDANGKLIKNKRVKGTVVQPDLMVVCDRDKIKSDGIHGAPDFIIEILSAATRDKDKSLKLYKYFTSGVKEYWIVDADEQEVHVYKFNHKDIKIKANHDTFTFNDKVKSHVLDGLEIDFSHFEFEFEEKIIYNKL